MNDAVLLEVADGVALITLNRPDRLNAVNGDVMQGLTEAVQLAADDPEAGCVVVTGAGRGFCSGGDTKEGASRRADGTSPPPELIRGQGLRRGAEASRLLREMPKPTIAMVNGPVAGAGIGIAGACDLRFASVTATFLSAYERIGAGGDYGATFVWPRILGAAKAREIFLLGEKFSAEEAYRFGIYNRLYGEEELRENTMAAAKRLADGPRSAWAYMKTNLNAAEDETFARHLDRESMNMGLSTQTYFSALRAARQSAS